MPENEEEKEEEHGPSCNCSDCYYAHDNKMVDEFGIPFSEEG
jgi:hypothetical protein